MQDVALGSLAVLIGAVLCFRGYLALRVVIGIGAIGFTLGTTAVVALGVSRSWVVVLVGLAVGTVLAVVAIVGDLPMLLLALLSAVAGASVVILGLLLIGGELQRADLTAMPSTAALDLAWWWNVVYGVLVLVGLGVQARSAAARAETLRTAWAA